MKLELTVPEVVDLIKEIQNQSENLFEMIRVNVKESVGRYLSELMDTELTHFLTNETFATQILGRDRYERVEGETNHRNGSYGRRFTLKGEEWISLRTTNIIERLNKEFKRRTKPMEILASERSCYILLAFICLKMELHWRSNPIGKVAHNLPFFQRLAERNFTQNS